MSPPREAEPGASAAKAEPGLLKELLDLTWPVLLQGLSITLLFFTDRLLMGRYSEDALGSMQVSGPVLWSVFSVTGAFTAGLLAVLGRAAGGGERERAAQVLRSGLSLALGLGIAVGLLGVLSLDLWVDLLAGEGGVVLRAHARDYMLWVFLSSPFRFLSLVAVTALQADGDTRSTLWISLGSGLVNLLLTSTLMFGLLGLPSLGVVGAALGTAGAFVVEACWGLLKLRDPRRDVRLRAGAWWRPGALSAVLRVSTACLGERLVFHTGFLIFAGLVGRLGDIAMTTNQILIAIESLGFIGADAFGIAASALVARKLGAGEVEAAQRAGWLAAGLGGAALVLVSALFLLQAEPLLRMFSEDPRVLQIGLHCLMIAAAAQPLMAIAQSLAGSLRGAGDTTTPLLVALLAPLGLRLTLCWWLAFELELGLAGIWWATTSDWLLRCVLLAAGFWRGRWQQVQLS